MEYINLKSFSYAEGKPHFFDFEKDYKTPDFITTYYFVVFSSSFEEAVSKIKKYKKTKNCLNIWEYPAFSNLSKSFPPDTIVGQKEPSGNYFLIAEVIKK